jgi:hypothetical protein
LLMSASSRTAFYVPGECVAAHRFLPLT